MFPEYYPKAASEEYPNSKLPLLVFVSGVCCAKTIVLRNSAVTNSINFSI